MVRPPSACGSCGAQLRPWHNIPLLSYLLQRGKCRFCKAKYSARYFVVELAAALMSLALFVRYVQTPLLAGGAPYPMMFAVMLAFALVLVVTAYIDLDFWIVPTQLTWTMTVVGLACAAWDETWLGVSFAAAAGTAAVTYAIFWSLRWVYLRFRGLEGFGLGDTKLLVMVAAVLGPQGLVFTVGAGAVQGLMVSVPLLLRGKSIANSNLHDVHGDDPTLGSPNESGLMPQYVPFGPFLALAALEYVFLRELLDAWVRDWVSGAW